MPLSECGNCFFEKDCAECLLIKTQDWAIWKINAERQMRVEREKSNVLNPNEEEYRHIPV